MILPAFGAHPTGTCEGCGAAEHKLYKAVVRWNVPYPIRDGAQVVVTRDSLLRLCERCRRALKRNSAVLSCEPITQELP